MVKEKILLLLSDVNLSSLLEGAALQPAGYQVTTIAEQAVAEDFIMKSSPDLIITSDLAMDGSGLDFVARISERYSDIPIILLPGKHTDALQTKALRLGVADYLLPPVNTNDLLDAVERTLRRRKRLEELIQLRARRNTRELRHRLDGLEALQQVARTVTASLDLDSVFSAIVDAAVELSNAEEGNLLLLDEASGELYMRAARNFQDDFVRKFRLPIRDTLAGQVLRTGKPVILDEKTPQKIKTAYLVHNLVYVPLQVQSRVIGVLGVDNRKAGHAFTDDHMALMASLADFAAIAIENARLYTRSEKERNKLETILTQVEDGMLVVDQEDRFVLANQTVREIFNLGKANFSGKPIRDIIQHADLLDVIEESKDQSKRCEIVLEDGRVFNTHITPIDQVGLAVTMQDITHLKELDRIKSDFVSTVSHDLRSPLTAILGYVELIDRAGPVTDQQREFIRRIQFSVSNITSLINDLLDLGRIEAGFDARKEIVQLPAIIMYAVEGLKTRLVEKEQNLNVDMPEKLPAVLGNPVRLRQMVGNLIGNAIKYTPIGGQITICAQAEEDQLILQIKDNGPGIPPSDQPFIFDKFYRGSNISYETPGTGLGLAIVRSIVENHQGRIWVESNVGQGSVFTVVLPISGQEE